MDGTLTSLAGYGIWYGIPCRGRSTADAQGANCGAPERAGTECRRQPRKRNRLRQRDVATIDSNSVFTIDSSHVNTSTTTLIVGGTKTSYNTPNFRL